MAPFAFAQDTKVKEEKKKGGTGGKGKAIANRARRDPLTVPITRAITELDRERQ